MADNTSYNYTREQYKTYVYFVKYRNHELIKNLHFNHHGRIYASIIQVHWAPNQNREYIIHIITTQKYRIIIRQQVQL